MSPDFQVPPHHLTSKTSFCWYDFETPSPKVGLELHLPGGRRLIQLDCQARWQPTTTRVEEISGEK